VVSSYTYDPFGSTSSSGTDIQGTQYTGRDNDSNGLDYYRARYYAPQTGRFISEDPAGFSGGINFYAYAGDNPVNNIDPSGLTTVTSTAWFPGASPNANGGFMMNVNDGSSATTVLRRITQVRVREEEQKAFDRLKACGEKNRSQEAAFDTGFFKGIGTDRDYYYVQGMDRIYADNEINYLGIGMYEHWLGDSLLQAKAITFGWNPHQYGTTPIPSGTWYWLQRGYDDYSNMGSGSSGGSSGTVPFKRRNF
jgi:RHS repeat-associated protein